MIIHIYKIFEKYCHSNQVRGMLGSTEVMFFQDFELSVREIETALKTKIIERLNAELIVMGGAELSTRYRDLILETTLGGENE